MSAVAVASMSEQEAQKLTERIRLTAHNYTEARAKLQDLVAEAKEGNAHLALGYASWTAYLSEVLGEEPMRLARSERQEMVQLLSSEGMSTRAIAPIVGADHATVARDVQSVANATDEPRTVESMDGIARTFRTQPEPAAPPAPKRRPLPEQARDAGWELRKAVERLERIYADDRYARNRDDIDALINPHITYALSIINN